MRPSTTLAELSGKTKTFLPILLGISIVVITGYCALGVAESVYGDSTTIGGGAIGTVTYSSDQITWTTTLYPASVDESWYSRLSIEGGQYSGTGVTISCQLQRKTSDTTWTDVGSPTTTSMTLGAGSQDVYATPTGASTNNRDWGLDVTEQGTYRVVTTCSTLRWGVSP